MDVITMIGNTGTYLDSPFHRYAEGPDLAGLDLSTLVGLRAEVFHLEDAWSAAEPRHPSRRRSPTATCAARRCCCTPAGTAGSDSPSTAPARRS